MMIPSSLQRAGSRMAGPIVIMAILAVIDVRGT